ncbi:MAG TPA: family 43 glycosylhydrolase [Chryseolinea sp.]|nr:family 43 glycosylhydrolase [Chryseolinea sp.]
MKKRYYIKPLTQSVIIIFVTSLMMELKGQTFSNPISDLADPHITYYENFYYLTGTTGSNITIKKAATLNSLKFAPPKVVFTPPSGGPCCNFWAPELHRINNTWYVYYTAGTNSDLTSQRTWVIENTSSDPVAGSWTNKGQIYHNVENFWAIDGSVFQLRDKNYFVWSGHSDASSTVQNIYISEMSSPWTLTGPRIKLSSPEYLWERNGEINEGPVVIQKNDKMFLIYSASGCWTDEYSLGMLTMNAVDNPLNASSWTKTDHPVFVTNSTAFAYGPGHNGFFLSPDGTELWNAYHATTIAGGACDFTRTTRAQKVAWNTDGTPDLGSPVATGRALTAPSGEIELPVSPALSNGIYKLVSKVSDKVLDIVSCSPALGADVVQASWTGKDCQRWNIQSTGDGYFVLTALRGGLALDVAGCSNDNFANVQTWAPNGAPCQQWKIEDMGNGYYRLLARNSSKVLTVVDDSQAEGANVIQQEWSDTDGQQWQIEDATDVVTAVEKNDPLPFFVFPNPVKNAFRISRASSQNRIDEVTLTDLVSRVVFHGNLSSQDEEVELNTTDLQSGLYFLQIRSGEKKFTTKIIVEK